jgi:LAO/AO transport system kinase
MKDDSRKEAARMAAERLKKAGTCDVPSLAAAIRRGERAALGQGITLIESTANRDKESAEALLTALLPHAGKAFRLGITGVPGVGKSTFIDALGTFLTKKKIKVAVLAIDPSSPVSGGAILGDKTRMERLSHDPLAFVRPSASAHTLGGVARKTRESMVLCEAAGYDIIIVETVGVGQSETAVHGMTDYFLLLMLAGAGDQLQGIKRGIMEMCDAMAITKSDGDNALKAQKARGEYASALHLFPERSGGWHPQVYTCSAISDDGMEAIWEDMVRFKAWMMERGEWDRKRTDQDETWFTTSMNDLILQWLRRQAAFDAQYAAVVQDIRNRKISPFAAAERLMLGWLSGGEQGHKQDRLSE